MGPCLIPAGQANEMENNQELKKGPWKPEEDLLLTTYVETHGEGRWATVSKRSGLMRGGKSCRLRWKNYLRPNLKREGISKEEEDLIIRMHKLLGNRWALIAGRLPGRTDNEVKNYWNTHLRMKRYHEPKSSEVPESKKKKPKLSHLPKTENFKTDDPNHNEVHESNNSHSSIEDKAVDQLQPDHYNDEQQWLSIEGRFFEEPYYHHLPFIDSTFFIESFGVDAGAVAGGGERSSYWTEYSNDQSVTYISEDLFQV